MRFRALFNLRNSAKFHPQNAGNRILERLHFKIFRGTMPSDSPSMAHALGFRPRPQTKHLGYTPLCTHGHYFHRRRFTSES